MNVTWEMVAGFVTVLAALWSGFVWIARKFDRLQSSVGKIDKKKVSHKTCIERQERCPCMMEFKRKIKDK